MPIGSFFKNSIGIFIFTPVERASRPAGYKSISSSTRTARNNGRPITCCGEFSLAGCPAVLIFRRSVGTDALSRGKTVGVFGRSRISIPASEAPIAPRRQDGWLIDEPANKSLIKRFSHSAKTFAVLFCTLGVPFRPSIVLCVADHCDGSWCFGFRFEKNQLKDYASEFSQTYTSVAMIEVLDIPRRWRCGIDLNTNSTEEQSAMESNDDDNHKH